MDRKAEQGAAAQGSDSETVRLLRAARARVAQGWTQGWTQGCDAHDAAGKECNAEDDRAVEWCLAGAVLAVAPGDPAFDRRRVVYETIRRTLGVYSFIGWNDEPGRTQAEVLAFMDKAIALAEAAK